MKIHRGKITGVLRDDGVYVTHKTNKHFFYKYNGFGISLSILNKLIEDRCKKIVVVYREDFKLWVKYETRPYIWKIKGIPFKFEDERQVILPLEYFERK